MSDEPVTYKGQGVMTNELGGLIGVGKLEVTVYDLTSKAGLASFQALSPSPTPVKIGPLHDYGGYPDEAAYIPERALQMQAFLQRRAERRFLEKLAGVTPSISGPTNEDYGYGFTQKHMDDVFKAIKEINDAQPKAADLRSAVVCIGDTGVSTKHLADALRAANWGQTRQRLLGTTVEGYRIQVHAGWRYQQVSWRSKPSRKKRRAYRVFVDKFDYPMKPGEYFLMEEARTLICRPEDLKTLTDKFMAKEAIKITEPAKDPNHKT